MQEGQVKSLKGRARVSQQEVKVKSKKSDRQGGQGYLNGKTRLIQDKSTKIGVFFSKIIKRLPQDFLNEELRINPQQLELFSIKTFKGRVRVISAKSKGYLNDKTRLIKDKSATVGVFFIKIIKRLPQDFLNEKLSQGYLKDKKKLIQDKSTTVAVFLSKNIKRSGQGSLSEKLR
ncbi:hypothetical protein M0802_016762 [Mischocyttarus mexicanus]|nr:hypothetical protein M0802_016762 [Mischocyttarus mexicanus]